MPLHAEVPTAPGGLPALVGGPRPARPELSRRRALQRGDRPGARRAGRPRSSAGPTAPGRDRAGQHPDLRGRLRAAGAISTEVIVRIAAESLGDQRRRSWGWSPLVGGSASAVAGLPFAVGMALALAERRSSAGCGSSWRRRRSGTGRSPARS